MMTASHLNILPSPLHCQLNMADPCATMAFSTIYRELHSVASGLIGGAKYGVKIRLPHALLMTFLFRSNLSASQKLKRVLQLSLEHAVKLAAFASIYKVMIASLKWLSRHLRNSKDSETVWKSFGRVFLSMIVNGPLPAGKLLVRATVPGYPERAHHALLAGTIGGYVVWGRYSSINHQILLYLASRMSVALWKRVVLKGESKPHPRAFSCISALMWGLAMMLYEESPHVLNPSLKSSMDEIYRYNLQSTGESTETSHFSDNAS